jgi:hypothetical protein
MNSVIMIANSFQPEEAVAAYRPMRLEQWRLRFGQIGKW